MRDDQHLAATFNLETHHEESDVNVRALIWFLVIFVVFGILTNLAVFGLFRFFVHLEHEKKPAPMTALSMPRDANMPDQPRLQPFPARDRDSGRIVLPTANTPVTDMNDMHAAEDAALQGPPQWIDPQRGVVRIPIARAMSLIAQRGLPASGKTAAPAVGAASPAGTVTTPAASMQEGDSNGGSVRPVGANQQPGPSPVGAHR
jgi:hypothetical protein